jgi:hypothetical protein
MVRIVLATAIGVLATATATAGASDSWTPLRRPLHLPKLAAGAACPVSRPDPRVDWERNGMFGGPGIGRGPVYPGLGAHSGLLWATRWGFSGSPWFGEKVFWYVLPSYQGPAFIRGRRLDGPEKVGFNGGKLPAWELHIAPGQTVTWDGQLPGSRGVPSGVRVREPGCYAFQIDGTRFSRIVVFVADLAR